MSASLLPDPNSRLWGLWGYSGWCVDTAIRLDNAPMLSECIDRGFVDVDTRMMVGTVLSWCDSRAPKCAQLLRERAEESRLIPPGKAGTP